jgi:L-ascorbate metabolism protein UlaG (beta-lactamase superfamily)
MLAGKTPPKSSILFSWINNYAGVLIRTPTKILLIDPVDVRAKSFPRLDAVLITHEHYDHLDQRLVAEIHKATGCRVIADQASAQKLGQQLPKEKLTAVSVGDKTSIGEVTVKAEKCQHPAKAPVTYIITSEDKLKIWHTADSLPYPDMVQVGKEEQFDLVFCTVAIAPGTSPETGSQIAWLTKPKIAVPYHTNSVESQQQFAQILKRDQPKTTCLVPSIGKMYMVTKGEHKT